MTGERTEKSRSPFVADRPRRSTRRWAIVASIILASLTWLAIDLYGPRATRMREFDPGEVARLDTAMWRSYYARERFRLFLQLAELLRDQYRLPLIRSHVVAYYAARSAFVFKDGRDRSDYERALPDLMKFYAAIRQVSDIPFDVERAARLELEWWIVHRERKKYGPGDLERALAALGSEVYRVPAERLFEYGRLRAEAMAIRDTKAEAGGVSEADWARIGELLDASWRSLWRAVNA